LSTRIRALPLALASAAVAALLLLGCGRSQEEAGQDASVKPPNRVARTASGEPVVTLDPQAQGRIDLKTAEALPQSLQPEVAAYGTLQEDPSRSFVVRAPVFGTLRRSASGGWPSLGQEVQAGSVIGQIEPRLSVVDRLNLRDRLAAVQADADSLAASLVASRAAYERARVLNAEDKNFSDRAVQEAEARMKGDEAKLQAARNSVTLIKASLDAATPDAAGVVPLVAQTGGQVVEVLAQPGEAIESGQPVARIAGFDQLLAKVSLPVGTEAELPISRARLVTLGREDFPMPATVVSLGAAVDPRVQGQTVLLRVQSGGLSLRAGTAVTAYIPASGELQKGVVVARSAVVRYAGRAWVYTQTAPDKFTRREVTLDSPRPDGWFTHSLQRGERVVVNGAQLLLSEELKSQIQVGEASEAE